MKNVWGISLPFYMSLPALLCSAYVLEKGSHFANNDYPISAASTAHWWIFIGQIIASKLGIFIALYFPGEMLTLLCYL